MNYAKEKLTKGEVIVVRAKVHSIVYNLGIILILAGFYLIFRLNQIGFEQAGVFFGKILVFAGIADLVKAFIFKKISNLTLSSQRIIARVGLIKRTRLNLKLTQIEQLLSQQNFFQKMFNFGTIVIQADRKITLVKYIKSPKTFEKQFRELIELNRRV